VVRSAATGACRPWRHVGVRSLVADLEHKILRIGEPIGPDEALAVLELPDTDVVGLVDLAHRVRLEHCGPEVEVESILSAKTGGCPEDCHFWSQSRHWPPPGRPEPVLDPTAPGEAGRAAR